jgi:hypothetical protein
MRAAGVNDDRMRQVMFAGGNVDGLNSVVKPDNGRTARNGVVHSHTASTGSVSASCGPGAVAANQRLCSIRQWRQLSRQRA